MSAVSHVRRPPHPRRAPARGIGAATTLARIRAQASDRSARYRERSKKDGKPNKRAVDCALAPAALLAMRHRKEYPDAQSAVFDIVRMAQSELRHAGYCRRLAVVEIQRRFNAVERAPDDPWMGDQRRRLMRDGVTDF